METASPRTVEELVAIVDELTRDKEEVWFRGHARGDWRLLPGLFREAQPGAAIDWLPVETSMMMRVRTQAKEFVTYASGELLSWLCLAQHYGLPTRLLDWSKSLSVGLYFSLIYGAADSRDPVLWLLRPRKWNEVLHSNGVITESSSPLVRERALLAFSGDENDDRDLSAPVCLEPDVSDSRISHQRSCFVMYGTDKLPMERYEDEHEGLRGHLLKVDLGSLPSGALSHLLPKASDVFRDLPTLAEAIRQNYLQKLLREFQPEL